MLNPYSISSFLHRKRQHYHGDNAVYPLFYVVNARWHVFKENEFIHRNRRKVRH